MARAPTGAGGPNGSFPWVRLLSAVLRYKWLIVGIVMAGAAAGYVLSRSVRPSYETYSTIWITPTTEGRNSGPIRASGLVQTSSWPELLRSFAILDRVSVRVPLFLNVPGRMYDSLFKDVHIGPQLKSGQYEIDVEPGGRFVLRSASGKELERGQVGDSVGRSIGLLWQPPASLLKDGSVLPISVKNPRSASVDLRNDLVLSPLREGSTLMRISLIGEDPHLIARTLNVLSEEFVATASTLKKKNLEETARILNEQLDYAQRELGSAEIALESFRVKTITLPAEGGPVAAGLEATRTPVMTSYFNNKIDADNLRRDREALERAVANLRQGKSAINELLMIPSVNSFGQELKTALSEHTTAASKLRSLQQVYQPDHPSVREASAALQVLERETIPSLAGELLAQLRGREAELTTRIGSASSELREIPARTIEEMRLRRNVQTRENLYLTLKNRYEEARLAEASSAPDLSVLDTAVAPLFPSRNTAPRLMMMALAGSVGFALVLALLLDRIDRRFRYPEQATRDLGLNILTAVPRIAKNRRKAPSMTQAAQVVEAFRTLRLSVNAAIPKDGPLTLTITSPGPADGKTLVSANLALAFAQAGYRTLLVDGDIRRGPLHSIFAAERTPGLVDCLRGDVETSAALRRTSHPNLTLMPNGSRDRSGPEYLASSALVNLFADLRENFDAILVDSPPLGVGVDPFALCMVTQNMLLVMRVGTTDRVLAQAKLEILDRLPVRVLGAALNDASMKGGFRYYSYADGYDVEGAEETSFDSLILRR